MSIFADTHDEARVARQCQDWARVANILAFVLLWRGIPCVLWGTEQGFAQQDNRNALWSTGFRQDTLGYARIAALNRVRRDYGAGMGPVDILIVDEENLVFTRRPLGAANATNATNGSATANGSLNGSLNGTAGANATNASLVYIFLNNANQDNATKPRTYCLDSGAPVWPLEPPDGHVWTEALLDTPVSLDSDGCYQAPDSLPKVVVAKKMPLHSNKFYPKSFDFSGLRKPHMGDGSQDYPGPFGSHIPPEELERRQARQAVAL
eukprot:5974683-Prymnesium_polylepis.2